MPRPEPGTIAVALHARDEAHLQAIADRLATAGIPHHHVVESDDDPKYAGQLMAIGVRPTTDRTAVRKVTSDLPLARAATAPEIHGVLAELTALQVEQRAHLRAAHVRRAARAGVAVSQSTGMISEVVLPRRVHPQPTPAIVALGDCGACVLGGLLGISIEHVYDDLVGSREALTFYEMARVLRVASYKGLADRIIDSPAQWPTSGHPDRCFGRPSWREALPWFSYVRMAVDAGYYGIAIIDTDGSKTMGNHWVLICGARDRGHAAYGNTITGEVLVSDSRRSVGGAMEWVEACEFLKNRGGYEIMFARPAA